MKEISPEAVAEKYNHLEIIWDEKDKWHTHTKAMINAFIKKVLITFDIKEWKILNAGSAGYSYDLEEKNILHVDIAAKRLENLKNSLVADIQKIPLRDQQFDLVICVGSVINYCDPLAVLKEFKRLLKTNGKMILEFENSYTLELIGKKSFNRKAVIVNSFYNGESEKVWFFSEKYILELAALYNFTLVETFRCHILSPLIYRIFKNEQFAAKFAKLDSILRNLPILNKFSSNTICLFTQC